MPVIIFTMDQPGFEPTSGVVLLISNIWLSEGKIKCWVAVFASFHDVNTPTMADLSDQHDVSDLGVGKRCI